MKINIDKILDEKISYALKEFSADAEYEIAKSGIPLTIFKSNEFSIKKDSHMITIGYSRKCEIFRGLCLAKTAGASAFDYNAKARFDTLSLMADNSRNAVNNICMVKRLVRILAALGYNELQLYTEDTLFVENQPYFGHMRGRFSSEEINDIDAYCALFGIELVPCIQTLAHFNAIFKWPVYNAVNDCEDILLPRSEKTYALLEDIIRSVAKNFSSRKINIGMDEAFLLGAGKFSEIHGYVPRTQIIAEHLKFVSELCERYKMTPMMWSDMFFRPYLKGEYHLEPDNPFTITPNIAKLVPDNISLVYWDYYSADSSRYRRMFERHSGFGKKIIFAGGAWKWSGFAPFNTEGVLRARAAADALKHSEIKDVLVTAWGDNGAECPLIAVLPQLVLYSEANYSDDTSDDALSKAMKVFCGADFDDFMRLDLPDLLTPRNRRSNISKCLLYNDPLIGLADYYIKPGFSEKFSEIAEIFIAAGKRNKRYNYVFDMMSAFCTALEAKCEIGVQIKTAYDTVDKDRLENIHTFEIPRAINKIRNFINAHRKSWAEENKPFGREVLDIRFAGIIERLEVAAQKIEDFLNGNINRIEELEQPRLPFEPADEKLLYRHFWHEIASPSIFTRHQ